MAKYLVSYDLMRPGQAYDKLIAELTKLGGMKVLLSTWLVKSAASAIALRDQLKENGGLDDNDRLFVTTVVAPSAWTKLLVDNQKVKDFYEKP